VIDIDDHESVVRKITDPTYVAYRTLDEARAANGSVIFEGDDGGQIYVTCPAVLVRCDAATLDRMLVVIDRACWPCNPPGRAAVRYEATRGGVRGGMGGGFVGDGVWIHEAVAQIGWFDGVGAVLRGACSELPEPELEIDDDVRAAIVGLRDELAETYEWMRTSPVPLRWLVGQLWTQQHRVPLGRWSRWYRAGFAVRVIRVLGLLD
jgi:hypothetical protein